MKSTRRPGVVIGSHKCVVTHLLWVIKTRGSGLTQKEVWQLLGSGAGRKRRLKRRWWGKEWRGRTRWYKKEREAKSGRKKEERDGVR